MFPTLRSTILLFALSIQTFALTIPISDDDHLNIFPRSSSAPSASPFHIRIMETEGVDLSQNITILLHNSLLSSAHGIPKHNLPGNRYSIVNGACLPDEIYFQKSIITFLPTNRLVHTVYCIPQSDLSVAAVKAFFGISDPSSSSAAPDQYPPGYIVLGASEVGIPATGVGDRQYALEAVLVAPDLRTEMNATRMQVEAQRSGDGNGQVLPAGLVKCTECSRLSIDPVPEETHSVVMNLVLQAGITAGTVLVGALIL